MNYVDYLFSAFWYYTQCNILESMKIVIQNSVEHIL